MDFTGTVRVRPDEKRPMAQRLWAICLSAVLLLTAVLFPLGWVRATQKDKNLLAGKQPVEYYVSGGGYNGAVSATGGVYYINDAKVTATAARLAGLTNGVTDTAKENCLHYPNNYYTEKRALVLVYDLGKSCDLAEIRLVGESGDERLGGVRLYAGDSYEAVNGGRADLFSHRVDTLADAGTDESGTVSQTLTGVTARYVAFVITGGVAAESARDSQAFLRELAVYEVQPSTEAPNLLAGKQPVEYYVSGGGYNGATSATGGVYYINGAKVTATAARLAGLTNGVTDTAKENCLHYPDNYYTEKRALVLVYDLGASYDLAEIRLVGESGDERLGGVRLYAGDSYEAVSGGRADLFSHRVDTLADAGTDESGTVSQTLTGVTARYVAFVITGGVAAESARDSQAFLRELAVYGQSDAGVPVTCSVVEESGGVAPEACTTTLPEVAEAGQALSFTVTPAAGFAILSVTVNGQVCVAADGLYTVPDVGETLAVIITVRRQFNLIANKLPMDFYAVDRQAYTRRINATLRVEGNPFTSMNGITPEVRDSLRRLTDGISDGAVANRCMLYAYDRNTTMAEKPAMVLVYDLGGLAEVNRLYFASTGEAGYYVAGYDYYISETLEELLADEHRVYSSDGNRLGADGELDASCDLTLREKTVSVTARGRYAAVVITRPLPVERLASGYMARAVEFAVYGYVPGTFPVTATVTEEGGSPLTGACSLDLPAFVPAGECFSFRVEPVVGYHVATVTVNGVPLTPVDGVYTAAPVAGAQTVAVSLRRVPTFPVTYEVVDEKGQPAAEACSADLPALVEEGATLAFSPAPAPGYAIRSVTANGGALVSADGLYTVEAVSRAQHICVTLESITNLIAGQPLTRYYAVAREDYHTPLYTATIIAGDTEMALTDGSIEGDSRVRIQTSGNPDGSYVTAGSRNIVLIYYLGGIADVRSLYFASTNEKGYYVAGYDYFIGDQLEGLLDEQNLVWSSYGNRLLPEDEETLDPSTTIQEREKTVYLHTPRRGRYAAVVITRPHSTTSQGYNMARISEIGVYGDLIEKDVLPNMDFRDSQTGVAVTFSAPSADVALRFGEIGVAGMDVELLPVTDVISSVLQREHCEAVSDTVRIRFYTAAGEMLPASAFDGYTCRISMPVTGDEFRFWYEVWEGVPRLVNNSTVRDGAVVGDTDSIYQDFVAAHFTRLEGQPGAAVLSPDRPDSAEKITGTAPDTGDRIGVLLWCSGILPAVLTMLYCRRRRRVHR